MASEILLATRSRDKAAEILAIIASGAPVRLLTLQDLRIPAQPVEEDLEIHDTFIDNAAAKARYFAALTNRLTLADDSGLMVAALKGGPGVRTRRFAADHGINAPDQDQANNELLLERLHDVPDHHRDAQYVCAAALAWPAGAALISVGTCRGRITRQRAGSGGFGYDPLFFVPELGVTFAQLTPAQKNERSHRALAMRALAPHLK